jgi:hypothetical protein
MSHVCVEACTRTAADMGYTAVRATRDWLGGA